MLFLPVSKSISEGRVDVLKPGKNMVTLSRQESSSVGDIYRAKVMVGQITFLNGIEEAQAQGRDKRSYV